MKSELWEGKRKENADILKKICSVVFSLKTNNLATMFQQTV
jgi:hypothetical protein